MFTDSDLPLLVDIFNSYHASADRLKAFLQPVAHALNYDDVVGLDVADGNVGFTAEWHGPYQSEDRQTFEFPLMMLPQGQEAIIARLRREREEIAQQAKANYDAETEQKERSEYERLRSRFETR